MFFTSATMTVRIAPLAPPPTNWPITEVTSMPPPAAPARAGIKVCNIWPPPTPPTAPAQRRTAWRGDTVKSLAGVPSKSTHDVWGCSCILGTCTCHVRFAGLSAADLRSSCSVRCAYPVNAAKESDESDSSAKFKRSEPKYAKRCGDSVASKQPRKHENRQTFCGALFEP